MSRYLRTWTFQTRVKEHEGWNEAEAVRKGASA
jgi:hypothetical protein